MEREWDCRCRRAFEPLVTRRLAAAALAPVAQKFVGRQLHHDNEQGECRQPRFGRK